jgi:hypothetical protein
MEKYCLVQQSILQYQKENMMIQDQDQDIDLDPDPEQDPDSSYSYSYSDPDPDPDPDPDSDQQTQEKEPIEYNNPVNEFFFECQQVIRSANKDQRAYIGVVQNKISLFCSFFSIHRAPIQYISYPQSFITHKQQTIIGYSSNTQPQKQTCNRCETILHIIQELDTPKFICFEHREITQSNYNSYNPSLHFHENIVLSFIHHLIEKCPQYDNNIDYNSSLPSSVKYEMIENNKKYNIIEFEKLIKSVFLQKMIPYKSYTFQSVPIKTKNDIIIRYHSQYIHVFKINKEDTYTTSPIIVNTDMSVETEKTTLTKQSQMLTMFIHMFAMDNTMQAPSSQTLARLYTSITTVSASILGYMNPIYIGTDLFVPLLSWKTKNLDTLYVFYKHSMSILVEETTSVQHIQSRKDIVQSLEYLSLLKEQLHRRFDVFSALYLYIYLTIIHTYIIETTNRRKIALYVHKHIKKALQRKKIIDIRGMV